MASFMQFLSLLCFAASFSLLADPVAEANRVMQNLINISAPQVKGAHDAEFVIVNDRAYIVMMANDIQPGESAEWPFVYCTMSIVDIPTMKVIQQIPMAKGGQVFRNHTLPEGACFVPRIIQKDKHTLRTFFASEAPKKREAQTYYLDFDLRKLEFSNKIEKMKIQTRKGTFDMQPYRFYDDAALDGFKRERKDYGMYNIDSFKKFDGKIYAVMNNFAGGQNALSILNKKMDTFTIGGHYNPSGTERLTESAFNRLPDGSWLTIIRQDGGTKNYMFSTSADGKKWTEPAYRDIVPNGDSSKPNFEKFGDQYYLCWQESTRVNDVSRSVFNIDVSKDGKTWTRKYRFATDKSFQYLSLHEYKGSIYITATQGDHSPSRKERVMFGKLE